jgi:hypothetical protein
MVKLQSTDPESQALIFLFGSPQRRKTRKDFFIKKIFLCALCVSAVSYS